MFNAKPNVNKVEENINKGKRVVIPDDCKEVTVDGIKFDKDEFFYKTTGCKFNCFDCGEELVSECGGFSLKDSAYCDNCDQKYVRDRDFLVAEGEIREEGLNVYRWDRLYDDTYECQQCNQTHRYSKPVEGWSKIGTYLHSYEGVSLNCACGNTIHLGKKVNELENCDKCGREHEIK